MISRPPIPPQAQARLQSILAAGRLGEAEKLCRQLLADPGNDAAHLHLLLGNILHAGGQPAKGLEHVRKAIDAAPGHSTGHACLAALLMASGQPGPALAAQMKAAACRDADAMTHQNLGSLLWQAGKPHEAIAPLEKAVALAPKLVAAWQSLGRLYRHLGHHDKARQAFATAVEIEPTNPDRWADLVQQRLYTADPAAIDDAARALALAPGDDRLRRHWLSALILKGRQTEAETECRQLLARHPDDAELILKLAEIQAALGRSGQAKATVDALIGRDAAVDPAHLASAHLFLVRLAYEQGDSAAAFQACRQAVAAAPDNPAVRAQYGWQLLSRGELAQGWVEFEHRFAAGPSRGGLRDMGLPQPLWQGQDLSGKTLLLWPEQGVGDDILQFSALAEVVAQAKTVHILCDPRMAPILRRSMPQSLVIHPMGEWMPPRLLQDDIDYQCSTGTMLRYLRPDFASFPVGRESYLRPDPDRVAAIRARYARLPGRKVGLAWDSKNHLNSRDKACPLRLWHPILRLPGITFVNLQYGDVQDQLDQVAQDVGVRIHDDGEIDQIRDMDGFLAQIAALDAVVSISNVTAHAAGAVGTPALVLLSANPLWVWFHDRADSPWYPQTRLLRQQRLGEWPPVLEQAAAILPSLL